MKHLTLLLMLAAYIPNTLAGLTYSNNTLTLTAGGPNVVNRLGSTSGGRTFITYALPTDRNGTALPGFFWGGWTYSPAGAGPVSIPWTTYYNGVVNKSYVLNPASVYQARTNPAATQVCLFNTNTLSVDINIGSCFPIDQLVITNNCSVSVTPTIAFGTVPSGAGQIQNSVSGSVRCDVSSPVRVTVGGVGLTQSRIDLVPGQLFADMTINGVDGIAGTTVQAVGNVNTGFTVGALLTVSTGTPGGAYSGNAVVQVEWF